MKKIAIFDFDSTLFNLRTEWIHKFPEKYLPVDSKVFLSDIETHMKDQELLDFIKHTVADHLYPNSFEVIDQIRKEYDEVIIMTFGYEPYQRLKVESSGLNKVVDRVVYLSGSKANLVKNDFIGVYKEIIFINDNQEENNLMKEINSSVKVVEIDNASPGGYTLQDFYESLL